MSVHRATRWTGDGATRGPAGRDGARRRGVGVWSIDRRNAVSAPRSRGRRRGGRGGDPRRHRGGRTAVLLCSRRSSGLVGDGDRPERAARLPGRQTRRTRGRSTHADRPSPARRNATGHVLGGGRDRVRVGQVWWGRRRDGVGGRGRRRDRRVSLSPNRAGRGGRVAGADGGPTPIRPRIRARRGGTRRDEGNVSRAADTQRGDRRTRDRVRSHGRWRRPIQRHSGSPVSRPRLRGATGVVGV